MAPSDEVFVELDESAAQRHALAVGNVADPVVRQVGAGEDEVAGLELADEVADEITPLRLDDLMKLELGMKMPADRAEGIPVRHHGEGFARPNLNQFQIGSHIFLPTPVI